MKNSIKELEKSTNEAFKMLLEILIDEEGMSKDILSAMGVLCEVIDASFAVQYSMADELAEIKRLVAQR